MTKIQTDRAIVMERGVALEALVSQLLGMLLDIEVDNSLSLGSKNSSLSLNSKINLLCDLKFVPRDAIWQFQIFTEIRNKFAHLQYVDSFEKCFEILKGKKNKFLKEFGKEIPETESEQIRLSFCFSKLCLTLSTWLQVILKQTSIRHHEGLKKDAVVESLRVLFKTPKDSRKNLLGQLEFVENLINEIKIIPEFISHVENNTLEE